MNLTQDTLQQLAADLRQAEAHGEAIGRCASRSVKTTPKPRTPSSASTSTTAWPTGAAWLAARSA
jgi:2-keto-4-pentenoate hydratase